MASWRLRSACSRASRSLRSWSSFCCAALRLACAEESPEPAEEFFLTPAEGDEEGLGADAGEPEADTEEPPVPEAEEAAAACAAASDACLEVAPPVSIYAVSSLAVEGSMPTKRVPWATSSSVKIPLTFTFFGPLGYTKVVLSPVFRPAASAVALSKAICSRPFGYVPEVNRVERHVASLAIDTVVTPAVPDVTTSSFLPTRAVPLTVVRAKAVATPGVFFISETSFSETVL